LISSRSSLVVRSGREALRAHLAEHYGSEDRP
jgi:hypothetical protein